MKPLLVTSGEPAGIGPEICLELVSLNIPLVVLADRDLLAERITSLGKNIQLKEYEEYNGNSHRTDSLYVMHEPCHVEAVPGKLDVRNVPYVLSLLTKSTNLCLDGHFSGLVTAPIHKGIINISGVSFTGHTEFLAQQCQTDTVVMMLACPEMNVALVTTHLPLAKVPKAITKDKVITTLSCLNGALEKDFGIKHPKLAIAGLNPHAGEGGYLGREEIEIISPCIADLQNIGMNVQGPFPADTMFSKDNLAKFDAFIAMYHDQGLSVLKYAAFNRAVNVTLGLPIIRTSVDHGTALEIAGMGRADATSLKAAVELAYEMVKNREQL